jgi:hypothetical protein
VAVRSARDVETALQQRKGGLAHTQLWGSGGSSNPGCSSEPSRDEAVPANHSLRKRHRVASRNSEIIEIDKREDVLVKRFVLKTLW